MTKSIFLALVLVTAMLGSLVKAADAPVAIGSAAPGFSLKDQAGKDVSLADFSGKIVVLEWFNEECPIVQRHYKGGAMNTLANKLKEKGVVWLAINSTSHATVASNAKADTAWAMNRPILDDASGKVGHAYAATNTPGMYVIDKEGKLAYRGAIDSDTKGGASGTVNYVEVAVQSLLDGKPVATPETKQYGCTVKYAGTK